MGVLAVDMWICGWNNGCYPVYCRNSIGWSMLHLAKERAPFISEDELSYWSALHLLRERAPTPQNINSVRNLALQLTAKRRFMSLIIFSTISSQKIQKMSIKLHPWRHRLPTSMPKYIVPKIPYGPEVYNIENMFLHRDVWTNLGTLYHSMCDHALGELRLELHQCTRVGVSTDLVSAARTKDGTVEVVGKAPGKILSSEVWYSLLHATHSWVFIKDIYVKLRRGEIQRKQVEKLIKHKKLRKVQKMLKNGKDTSWGRDPCAKLVRQEVQISIFTLRCVGFRSVDYGGSVRAFTGLPAWAGPRPVEIFKAQAQSMLTGPGPGWGYQPSDQVYSRQSWETLWLCL
ncbi:hypothetical protein Scep_025516 [Stephania cephalantha]|uniref:Uncharacterized protein n=1 Tax=Stephania cephalantha TaxID=152367 RepID=A0AAP0HR98_9MAGN